MPSPARSIGAVVVFTLLLAATAWLLDQLAQHQFTAHLRDQAAHALALESIGDTPYRWQFHAEEDLVAGRVFNANDFSFHNGEFVVHSNGNPFEIGLPLTHPIDLLRFPHLRIAATAEGPAIVHIVVRENLHAAQTVSVPFTVSAGDGTAVDLSSTGWNSPVGDSRPEVAAMLRLRFELPAGHALRLRAAILGRIDDAQRVDLVAPPAIVEWDATAPIGAVIFRLPERVDAATLSALGARIDVHATPMLLLPGSERVERRLLALRTIHGVLPAAIVIPQEAFAATFARAHAQAIDIPGDLPDVVGWLALGLYALLLLLARLRPPHALRLRALMEIVLALAAPLWLILGGHFDGNPGLAQKLLIGVGLIYAISLSVPKHWRWNGSVRAWLLAGAVLAVAALLGLAAHHPDETLRTIDPGHIARYLAWALLQQYLICAVCTERWRIVTGNAALAAYLGALGFALMHTPNAALMLATLLGGLCWCALYLRERALLPLAVSHAASALLLLALLPADILASAEVSARFFQ